MVTVPHATLPPDIGPYRAAQAMELVDALTPQPIFPDRLQAFSKWSEMARSQIERGEAYQLVYLSDGLAGGDDADAFSQLVKFNVAPILWYQEEMAQLVGLTQVVNMADAMQVQGVRLNHEQPTNYLIAAYDKNGRRLGETEMVFAAGQVQAKGELALPLEMRNDVLSLKVEEVANVVATYLLSSSDKRKRVGLVGATSGEMMAPLLSPLYYPMRALAPFADMIPTRNVDLTRQLEEILDAGPALIVMGDEANIVATSRERLNRWIETGGSLLRFAGPRLAASGGRDDGFLPVRLRRGDRSMGGVMSWAQPQKIAPISPTSPLFGLEVPDDVTISRQILGDPEPQLFDKSWVLLEDGTPLVTGETRGQGRVILVHTTASPEWSNLALSGFFVEMLQRLVMQAHAGSSGMANDFDETRILPPWRILSVEGQLQVPPAFVQPLENGQQIKMRPDAHHPPGLYGDEEGEWVALNLFETEQNLQALTPLALTPMADFPILPRDYETSNNQPLAGWLWALALILFTLDCLIMTLLGKAVWPHFKSGKKAVSAAAAMIAVWLLLPLSFMTPPVLAQSGQDSLLVTRAAKTHLAYIKTGNRELDNLSASGLEVLSQFITSRTTIELGDVVAVDLEGDELSFYPLLYWPIDAAMPPPDREAMARLANYMRQGGSVLFDTRDQLTSGFHLDGSPTEAGAYLRAILSDLDMPPLEPAPLNHVVARSFYIMPDFPGRYRGSPLWLEALDGEQDRQGRQISPSSTASSSAPIVRSGDGVSPILITANDFIGAWAQNAHADWLYPTVPDEPMQRLWALRGGLNIVLYMLSGNYKADQIHAPELLRRLGE